MSLSRKQSGVSRNAVASQWSVDIKHLSQCGSSFEIAVCLRGFENTLENIDAADRIKYCKADFEMCIRLLREKGVVFSGDLTRAIIHIMKKYFEKCAMQKLPEDVFQEVLSWLPLHEFCNVASVSSDWKQHACSNMLWKNLFERHFRGSTPLLSHRLKAEFYFRYQHPQIGDRVEVAWRGKFRLEAMEIYQGLAWWVAEIVDRDPEHGRYKVRYPGWENRWDEWVDRGRLRWAVEKDFSSTIRIGDAVELWCCGYNVPGAWLESTVRKVRHGRYFVARALTSGSIWVDRSRLRPRRHAPVAAQTALPQSFATCLPEASCAIM